MSKKHISIRQNDFEPPNSAPPFQITHISKSKFQKQHSSKPIDSFKFLIQLNPLNKNQITLISDPGLKISPAHIKEAMRRIQFLDQYYNLLDTHYKPPYAPKKINFDQKLAQYPYVLNTQDLPNLYGFTKLPDKILFLSGVNFIEKGPHGLFTNPQYLFDQYAFFSSRLTINDIRVPKPNKWDANTKEFAEFYDNLITETAKYTNKKTNDLHILDVGCGSAFELQILNHLNKYPNLYGIDIDQRALTLTNQLIKKDNLSHIKIKKLDFLDPQYLEKFKSQFKRTKFDVLLFTNSMEHFSDPEKVCKNLSALLNPGGRLILIGAPDLESLRAQFNHSFGDFQKTTHFHFFTKASLASLGQKNGLKFTSIPEYAQFYPNLDLLFEESFPSIINGQWHFFDQPMPNNIKFENLFQDQNVPKISVFQKDPKHQNKPCGVVGLRYYKHYTKNKNLIELIQKDCLLKTIQNPEKSNDYIKELKTRLFNTLILNKAHIFRPEQINELQKHTKLKLVCDFNKKVRNMATIWGYWEKPL